MSKEFTTVISSIVVFIVGTQIFVYAFINELLQVQSEMYIKCRNNRAMKSNELKIFTNFYQITKFFL